MYGPPNGYAPGPPGPYGPRPSAARQAAPWLVGAAVTVGAAAIVIALVLTGGGGGGAPVADGSSSPSTGTVTRSSTPDSTSVGPTTGAPTTDVLPANSGAASCSTGVQPGLVAVSVATVLGVTTKGSRPNSYVGDVLRDCTSASVRSRLDVLFGITFGSDYSADLTGGDGTGATAQYRVSNRAGTGTLTLTLTRQQDGHYEVTGFSYSG